MKSSPAIVAFDIIETVFSLEPLRTAMISLGLPHFALELWFAQTLRDGMALDAAGDYKPFREVARAALEVLLAQHGCTLEPGRIETVLQEVSRLPCYPDAQPAFRQLHEAGIRIVALTNGSAQTTQKLLQGGALETFVERVISAEEVRHWKPRPEVYRYAARILQVKTHRLALVATHPWDIQGAARAGLTTAFVARGKAYPTTMMPPDCVADELAGVAEKLRGVGA